MFNMLSFKCYIINLVVSSPVDLDFSNLNDFVFDFFSRELTCINSPFSSRMAVGITSLALFILYFSFLFPPFLTPSMAVSIDVSLFLGASSLAELEFSDEKEWDDSLALSIWILFASFLLVLLLDLLLLRGWVSYPSSNFTIFFLPGLFSSSFFSPSDSLSSNFEPLIEIEFTFFPVCSLLESGFSFLAPSSYALNLFFIIILNYNWASSRPFES